MCDAVFGRGAQIFGVLLLLAASAGQVAAEQQMTPFSGNRTVRVTTLNVYHGVNDEIFAVPSATSVPDLLQKVAAVYHGYFERNFSERAAVMAAEIDAARPELIGLQEAILVRTQFPADGPATAATTVALDYVDILLDALAARGLQYEVVVQMIGLDAELPSALGFDVRHTDREVILARSDLTTADLKLSNAQAGHFIANCQLPGPLGMPPIVIRRGWVSVDAKIRGRGFRFLSTHLDGDCLPFTSAIQQAQAAELLAGPATTKLPVVLVGDLNSPGDGTGVTYNSILTDGFSDAWTAAGGGPGETCCQASDLLNATSTLERRIDFVLFRGAIQAVAAEVIGADSDDRTASGLWPSDHASVVAALRVNR